MTLLELMIALSLTGMLLGSAGGILYSLLMASERVARRSADATVDSVGERLLRDLLARVEPTPDSAQQFEGAQGQSSFGTWCESAAGGLVPCIVNLRMDSANGVSNLSLQVKSGIVVDPLWRDVQSVLYAESDGSRERWHAAWARGFSAPVAFAIVTKGDTLVFPVGLGR